MKYPILLSLFILTVSPAMTYGFEDIPCSEAEEDRLNDLLAMADLVFLHYSEITDPEKRSRARYSLPLDLVERKILPPPEYIKASEITIFPLDHYNAPYLTHSCLIPKDQRIKKKDMYGLSSRCWVHLETKDNKCDIGYWSSLNK